MIKVAALALLLACPTFVLAAREPAPATTAPADTALLPTAPNFRDIGGYAAASGRHVARGKVYRSSELSSLSPADAAAVADLHLAAVVDLRTIEERQRAPSVWSVKPADVVESPKQTLAPFTHAILGGAVTAEGAKQGIKSFYRQMPKLYQEEYAAMFHRIALGELPMVVHCTAGKDRTGVAMAVLLESLGTPRAIAVRDYSVSNARLALTADASGTPTVGARTASVTAMSSLPLDVRRALWEADPDYITAALESIDAQFGSVEAYVRTGLGVSVQELQTVRDLLTE